MLKRDLRNTYRKKRSEISGEAVKRNSEAIGLVLSEWLSEQQGIRCIHSFLPALNKNEVDTFEILRLIREKFPLLTIAVPRVATGARLLTHHIFTPESVLTFNKWGIPEPATSETVGAREFDAVLIPMMIFDHKGHRVGYGGGFYDSFLPACRPDTRKIGLCFFSPVDIISDVGPYDIKMDICITPERLWDFR